MKTRSAQRADAARSAHRLGVNAMHVHALMTAFALCAVLILPIGCGGEDEPAPPPPVAEVEEPAAVEPPPAPMPPVILPVDEAMVLYESVLAEVLAPDGGIRRDAIADPDHHRALAQVIASFANEHPPETAHAPCVSHLNIHNAQTLHALGAALRLDPELSRIDDINETTSRSEALDACDDPRILAALGDGSIGGPPLRAQPYTVEDLDDQLDDQCRRWINTPAAFRIVDGSLGLCALLQPHRADFDRLPYGNLTGFILGYVDPASDIAAYIINEPTVEISWIDCDRTIRFGVDPPSDPSSGAPPEEPADSAPAPTGAE